MVTEVLAALSSGLPRAEDAAGLSWKALGAVYPRGYGTGYCHLGGVLSGLRRCGSLRLGSEHMELLISCASLGGKWRAFLLAFSAWHVLSSSLSSYSYY